MSLDYSVVTREWNGFKDRELWTHIRPVISGDGQTPPTVRVPPAKAQYPGEIYWHDESVDNKARGVAIDNTGVLGTGGPGSAGLEIEVGYPPGHNDILYVVPGLTKDALQQTGGQTPVQRILTEQRVLTLERFPELQLSPGAGMVPLVSAGKWRAGNTPVNYAGGNGPDLTSSIPATSGKSVWVLVSQDSTTAFSVAAGSEVDTSEAFATSHLPPAFESDKEQIAWVKLDNGMTDLDDAIILPIANIPALGGASSGLALQPTVITADETIPVDYEAISSTGIEFGTGGSLTIDGSLFVIDLG